jgi:hypothetical protein
MAVQDQVRRKSVKKVVVEGPNPKDTVVVSFMDDGTVRLAFTSGPWAIDYIFLGAGHDENILFKRRA